MKREKIKMKGFKFRKVTCYERGEVDPADVRVGDIITIANKDMTVSHVGLGDENLINFALRATDPDQYIELVFDTKHDNKPIAAELISPVMVKGSMIGLYETYLIDDEPYIVVPNQSWDSDNCLEGKRVFLCMVGCEDPETVSAAITHPKLRSIDENTLYQRIILEPCD